MKLKGDNLVIFKDDKVMAYGLSCEVDLSAELLQVSSPMHGGWDNYECKRWGWGGSSSMLVSAHQSAREIYGILADPRVKIHIASVRAHRDAIAAGDYKRDEAFSLGGDAIITRITITGQKGTSATLSLEFKGCGKPTIAGELVPIPKPPIQQQEP